MSDTGQEAMIEEIMKHLDAESAQGVYRMSIKIGRAHV